MATVGSTSSPLNLEVAAPSVWPATESLDLKNLLLRLRTPALLAILIGLSFWFHFQPCVRGDDLNYSYQEYI